jgi:LacI family transcriptional regulator
VKTLKAQPTSIAQRTTLSEDVLRILRVHLYSGRWRGYLPGERTLSEELQVSRPTLRLALNVLEREGWLKVVHGRRRQILDIHPRQLPPARRNVIAVLSPQALESVPPFALYWIDAVRSNLAKSGYQLEFHASASCASQHPDRVLESLVQGEPASLWILFMAPRLVQEWFADRQISCLVTGSCEAGIELPSIDTNYRAACRHAAGLFHARGHSRLALVIPATGLAGDADTEKGFQEGVGKGMPPLILRHDGSAQDLIRKMEGCLRLPEPPSGFLVARAEHSLTVMTFLMTKGYQLPRDAAVISRDDDAFLDAVVPPISRYIRNRIVYSRRLSRTILQMVRSGRFPARTIRLIPEFIEGQSV